MFKIEDCSLQGLWNLSHSEEKKIEISEDVMKHLDHHDLLAINFLYQNHRKNYKGAILNEQNGLNMQLQVSVFLNLMFRCIEQKFLTLIITPEYLMVKWYQYLTNIADLKIVRLNSKTCPEDFDDQHGVALLVSFEDIQLIEHIIEYNFFAVIIDCFDEIAKKPIIRRLYGDFHIGLSTRNFYFNPDQRLQWIMLNWCSPGCCGESKRFVRIDNDNFANFRNNYRHWWFRLTGYFCESLKTIVNEEKVFQLNSRSKKSTYSRRKKARNQGVNEDVDKEIKSEVECMETESHNNDIKIEEDTNDSETNSVQTQIDIKESTEEKELEIKRSFIDDDDDDDPINILLSKSENQNSQMESFSTLTTQSEIAPNVQIDTKNDFLIEDKNILLSLVSEDSHKDSCSELNPESEIFLKKEELSTQLFSEFASTSTVLAEKEDSTEFLRSLID